MLTHTHPIILRRRRLNPKFSSLDLSTSTIDPSGQSRPEQGPGSGPATAVKLNITQKHKQNHHSG